MRRMADILGHPHVTVGVGVVFMLSGLFEISETAVESAVEGLFGIDLALGHGIALVGIVQVLKGLAEVIAGSREISRTKQDS